MARNNQKKFKIYFTGADKYGWALDEDYNQTIQAVESFAKPSKLEEAEIIHSVYWEALREIPDNMLLSLPVICNLSGEWNRYEKDFGTEFLNIAAKVNTWIVRSKKALKEIEDKGYKAFYVPYTVNTETFKPLSNLEKTNIRKKLNIPNNAYVIGNFMRDSLGGNLYQPKKVKGPDIFVDIVKNLKSKNIPICILLAGPRRHWIRKELRKNKVPYKYAGIKVFFDDMRINTLNRKRLNELYNILDLSLVTSRSEAGPHAILEAAASMCPQLSSRVGIAGDVLKADQIFDTIEQAEHKIIEDIKTKKIYSFSRDVFKDATKTNTPEFCSNTYLKIYNQIDVFK